MDKPNTFTLYTSKTENLREFANQLGIPIPDGASRFDIIDLIRLFPEGLTNNAPPADAPDLAQMSLGGSAAPLPDSPEVAQPSVRIQRIRDQNS